MAISQGSLLVLMVLCMERPFDAFRHESRISAMSAITLSQTNESQHVADATKAEHQSHEDELNQQMKSSAEDLEQTSRLAEEKVMTHEGEDRKSAHDQTHIVKLTREGHQVFRAVNGRFMIKPNSTWGREIELAMVPPEDSHERLSLLEKHGSTCYSCGGCGGCGCDCCSSCYGRDPYCQDCR